ncbi:MAG: arginine--tRNA ligase [Halarcobacter sp.]
MQKQVKDYIENILQTQIVLEKPKDISLGHFATPVAFSLAKEFRKSPMIIADELVSKFDECEMFEKVEAVKGFINFKLSKKFLESLSKEVLILKDQYGKEEQKEEKILLEFVSANPTGPLHIGHARGAIQGDSLCKVGRHLGYNITTEYYVNDAGAQMDLLAISLALAGQEFVLKKDVEYPEKYYRGEYLIDIAQDLASKYGTEIFEDETKLKEMTLFAKDKVLEIIKKDMSNLGIVFDNYVSEKSLYVNWEDTKKVLEDNGSLYEKDEKIWIKSSKFGDDVDRVVVRDNGIPTYLAGDIIYHKNKYDRAYDKYINIWGADHHGYIARVKAAIKFLGYEPEKLEVLLSQMVQLLKGGEPYKMSKRAGNVILMSDIVEEIGADALRFVFLTKKSDTHLDFDIDKLKNQDSSNPVFYINYAYARINQVFKKAEKSFEDVINVPYENLNEDGLNLVFESLLLPSILNEAFNKRDMQKITDYLYSLASSIHRFYNEYKIVDSKEQDEYLKVLSLSALTIKVALNLLGIKVKETM